MIKLADPKAQFLSDKEEILRAVRETLDSGQYILGPHVSSFETKFAEYLGVSHVIGVGSGTEALHIVLRSLGVGAGDEVITTANTAVATVAAIVMAGAKPVFVDIDQRSQNIDPNLIESSITPRTKAIIPVHLYGQVCDMRTVMDIAETHDLCVVEDCAQATGAWHHSRRAGSIGDAGCFSFYPTKNLGALGDGGAIATSNETLAERIRLFREYGWRERFVSCQEGWNSRLDELQAAVLGIKLVHLDQDNCLRQKHAGYYQSELQDLPLQLPLCNPIASHVFHLFVIRSQQRDELVDFLRNQGIQVGIQYPIPIHLQPYYQSIVGEMSLPNTERAAAEILSLPIYPEIPDEHIRTVAHEVRRFYGK